MGLRIASRLAPRDADSLLATAATAFQNADRDALLRLAADAGELTAPQEAYRGYRALVEMCLGGSGDPLRLVSELLLAAELGTIALEAEPREPVLLNLTGVALYELGAYGAADDLFVAADRLAPGLTEAADNRKALNERRRQPAPKLNPVVTTARAALAKRASAAAKAAHPVAGRTLSLCMIVRDEEEALPRCLASIRDFVDEIVIVDTGSTDATVQIAESFGAKVLHFPWTGSFAEARNVSFAAATGDWMMFLDADEVLIEEDGPKLRELLGRTWREAFHLTETSYVGAIEDGAGVTHNALRLFRNREAYRFEGRIHEQILHTLPTDLAERFEAVGVRVEHFGYLGVVRDAKQKSRRNLELLEAQSAEGVDTPFHHFNLGSEYAALAEGERAAEHLRKAWDTLIATDRLTAQGYGPSLTSRLVKALRACGRPQEASTIAAAGLVQFPGFTDLVFEQAGIARDAGDLIEARRLLELCLELGDGPAKYTATVGCGTHLALTALAGVEEERRDPVRAESLLRKSLHDHPRHLAPVDPLARLMLRRGATPAEVHALIRETVPDAGPAADFSLGLALLEAGEAEAADPCFRAVLERQPHSDVARVGLAESLLARGDVAGADAIAREIGSGGTCTPAARRIEAFSALVAGDADRLDKIVATGELADSERELVAAWAQLLRGEAGPATLPPSAAAPLEVTLAALLRVVEVDAFGAIVPLLERTGTSARRRHETLAQMYLRAGFLDSAAEEWSAACAEHGVDADALVGLAQVALAAGEAEDALVFAEGAAEIAPGDARPPALREALLKNLQD